MWKVQGWTGTHSRPSRWPCTAPHKAEGRQHGPACAPGSAWQPTRATRRA